MKRLLVWALTLITAVECLLPVGAANETEATPPVVYSTAELLEAIEEAEDGDTIYIGDTISQWPDQFIGAKERHLTLMRDGNFTSGALFSFTENTTVTMENLIIDGNGAVFGKIETEQRVPKM